MLTNSSLGLPVNPSAIPPSFPRLQPTTSSSACRLYVDNIQYLFWSGHTHQPLAPGQIDPDYEHA